MAEWSNHINVHKALHVLWSASTDLRHAIYLDVESAIYKELYKVYTSRNISTHSTKNLQSQKYQMIHSRSLYIQITVLPYTEQKSRCKKMHSKEGLLQKNG